MQIFDPVQQPDATRRRNRRGGFTLIELVVSMTVSVIICGSAAMLVYNCSRFRSEASARAELSDMASAGLELIVRYVREVPQIGAPVTLTGQAQIDTASATQLRFGNNGFRYDSATSTLQMTTNNGGNWYTIASDAAGMTFSYYDRTGSALAGLPLSATDCQAVRRIVISVTLSRNSQTATVRTGIYLRSFENEVTHAAP